VNTPVDRLAEDETARLRAEPSAATPSRVISCPSAAGTLLLALLAGGCSYLAPTLPVSETHLTADKAAGKAEGGESGILAPVSVPTPPPPKPQPKLPTYSVVVNEVPIKELLFALARDTKQNIDIHPGLQGLVSLNAIDETLPAILDRIAKQGNLRWRQDGRTIQVSPDVPYVKTYKVDYVNVSRDTQSTAGVQGLVGTVGTLAVPQGATNVVPGRCVFSLDVRAADDATRDAAIADLDAEFQRIARQRGVELDLSETMRVPCAACSPQLRQRLADSVAAAGVPVLELPSGAGHDAMVLARITEVGMLFVRCGNGGISHNPLETMAAGDADIAARVLLDFLRRTAAGVSG